MNKTPKKETLAEYLARGGTVTKCPRGGSGKIPNPHWKQRSNFYRFKKNPNGPGIVANYVPPEKEVT